MHERRLTDAATMGLMVRAKPRRRPFVITVMALASTAQLECGSTDEDSCDQARPPDACSTDGKTCSREVACASGTHSVSVTCEGGYWRHSPTACEHQGDECDMHYRCESGSWAFYGYGGNPPAACPETPPADGATCDPSSPFGSDPSNCGYPCENGAGWLLVSCGESAVWTAAACDPNG